MANWQEARLISVAGISGDAEAEQRATSALLAVLSIVRPFSKALLAPLGASRADKAVVETFIETAFKRVLGVPFAQTDSIASPKATSRKIITTTASGVIGSIGTPVVR